MLVPRSGGHAFLSGSYPHLVPKERRVRQVKPDLWLPFQVSANIVSRHKKHQLDRNENQYTPGPDIGLHARYQDSARINMQLDSWECASLWRSPGIHWQGLGHGQNFAVLSALP